MAETSGQVFQAATEVWETAPRKKSFSKFLSAQRERYQVSGIFLEKQKGELGKMWGHEVQGRALQEKVSNLR